MHFPAPFQHLHEPVRNVNDVVDATSTVGQRVADRVAEVVGSWPFILTQGVLLVGWVVMNLAAWVGHWDPYPFILLNLFLSMLAGLQGSILLIAAKRQDAVAAALARHDFATNVAAKREIEELLAVTRAQLRILTELREERDAERAASADAAR
jgi:uncharacterized membrane protein